MDQYDVAVIGAGPGGYVAAIRAAQLGKRVCLVEKRSTLGGTCLNIGCIPSKALLESSELFAVAKHEMTEHGVLAKSVGLDLPAMMRRKEKIVSELVGGLAMLMKKNKIEVIEGVGRLQGPRRFVVSTAEGSKVEIAAEAIVLAMGSEPIALPFLQLSEPWIVDSTGALSFSEVPKHLAVIGGGAIGLELGSVWARLGAKVTVVELLPRLLARSDAQIAKQLQKLLSKQGLDFRLGCKVTGAELPAEGQKTLKLKFDDEKGQAETLDCDRILVAVGRRPRSEDAGLEEAGVALDAQRRVRIDDHFRTNVDGVFAIGDLVAGPMLAHKAEDEGMAVAELIAGLPGHVNYDAIPNVVYTWPELAEVGLSEEAAREAGLKVKIGKYSFRPNGRAKTLVGHADGTVKLIAHAETDQLLGAHIVGPRASDMIAELVVAKEFSASAEDIARSTHAHPTLSEVVKEAALAVDNRVIHG